MQTPSYIIYIINKGLLIFDFYFLFFMVENIAYYVLFEDTLWTREISKGSDQSDPQCFLRPQQCHSEEG